MCVFLNLLQDENSLPNEIPLQKLNILQTCKKSSKFLLFNALHTVRLLVYVMVLRNNHVQCLFNV